MCASRSLAGLLACCLIAATAGCTSGVAFSRLPSREDVATKTSAQLLSEYQDIYTYRPSSARHFFSGVFLMPPADPMVSAWGAPDRKRLSWWNLVPGLLVPPVHPLWVYEWRVGDKQIVALLDAPLLLGYRPHVWTLSIREAGKQ